MLRQLFAHDCAYLFVSHTHRNTNGSPEHGAHRKTADSRVQDIAASFDTIYSIHDADDGSVDRRVLAIERFTGSSPFQHRDDQLATSCANRVDGQESRTGRLASRRLWLHEKQLGALKLWPLVTGDDLADHSTQDHDATVVQ